jgi:hypothetical protein
MVVQPTAFIKRLLHQRFLSFGGINPILESLTHIRIIAQNKPCALKENMMKQILQSNPSPARRGDADGDGDFR